jgi:hypothetical protein
MKEDMSLKECASFISEYGKKNIYSASEILSKKLSG